MSSTMKNIIVFGETGSGKSSIVNMLLGRQAAQVSDSAIGCTFRFERYGDNDFNYYDTVGLSEASGGTMSSKEAISNLIKLLKSLTDGVSLLVYVVKKGRITKAVQDNYKLFADAICLKEAPVILVITHCEDEETMGTWWTENKIHFDNYGMKFVDAISACASTGETMHPVMRDMVRERYGESTRAIQSSIQMHCLSEPWKMANWETWFKVIFLNVYNLIRSWIKMPQIPYWEEFKEAFVNEGHSDQEATVISNEICEKVLKR